MGKGDRKTAKGKRYNASYGNARKATSKATGALVTVLVVLVVFFATGALAAPVALLVALRALP